MLNIAGAELTGSGSQKLFPCDFTSSRSKGHDILKLVAKPVSAAQLIKSRSGPNAAGERLIEEPAIDEQIHGSIGRRNLYPIEDFIPTRRSIVQNQIQVFCTILAEQFSRLFFVFGLPKKEHHFGGSAGTQFNGRLQRGARIQARANFSRKQAAEFETIRTLAFRSGLKTPSGLRYTKFAFPQDPQRRYARQIHYSMRSGQRALPCPDLLP